jgi:hypothetical protein
MKKLIFAALIGFGTMFLVTSCTNDAGDNCKYCYIQVTDADGNVVSEGTPEEYCGSDLDAVDGSSTSDGDNTSEYICDAANKK